MIQDSHYSLVYRLFVAKIEFKSQNFIGPKKTSQVKSKGEITQYKFPRKGQFRYQETSTVQFYMNRRLKSPQQNCNISYPAISYRVGQFTEYSRYIYGVGQFTEYSRYTIQSRPVYGVL